MSLVDNDILVDIEGLSGVANEETATAQPMILSFGPIGTTITPIVSSAAPLITFHGQASKLYTIIMTDPDAISRTNPVYREFIHWVGCNLTFDTNGKCNASECKHIVDYIGPAPPYRSGLHRYVFLLYEQPAGSTPETLVEAFEGRGGKRAHLAATAAGLGPVASINWYQAQWDESVDALHDAIGFMPPADFQSPYQTSKSQ
jgi:phosphatidylethanolamine-binding protein